MLELSKEKIKTIEKLFELKYQEDSGFYKTFIGENNNGFYRQLVITNYSVTYSLHGGSDARPSAIPIDLLMPLAAVLTPPTDVDIKIGRGKKVNKVGVR